MKALQISLLLLVFSFIHIRANEGEWRRHSWGIPVHFYLQERLLDLTVFNRFPSSAPIMARKFSSESPQRGVWLGSVDGKFTVFASVSRIDILQKYWDAEISPKDLAEINVLAQKARIEENINESSREISHRLGERIIAFWQISLKQTRFRKAPIVHSVWSMQAESANGSVIEGDFSDIAAEPPVSVLVTIAETLIAYSNSELSEVEFEKIMDSLKGD